jgi:hypothetical protein
MWPLTTSSGAAGQNPAAPAQLAAGEEVGGGLGSHLQLVCGRSLSQHASGDGVWRRRAATAAGASAPAMLQRGRVNVWRRRLQGILGEV